MAELRTLPLLWDELVDAHGNPRPAAAALVERLRSLDIEELQQRQGLAEVDILALGITFTVYHDGQGTDRAWPMDIVPRVIAASEWARIELGLKQRLNALNRFIDDVYHDRRIVADGVFPAELLADSVNLRPECADMSPKFGVWAHICGSDLVRDADGVSTCSRTTCGSRRASVTCCRTGRSPNGRSPTSSSGNRSCPSMTIPIGCAGCSSSLASDELQGLRLPQVVVLTPGVYNSAYFEHAFLAQQMGVPLVEGADLFVDPSNAVWMRTIDGPQPVDVDLPAHRRPVPRSGGVPQGFTARRTRSDACVAGRQGGASPMRRVPASPTTRSCTPGLPTSSATTSTRSRCCPTCRPIDACTPTSSTTSSITPDELVLKPANESGGYGLTIGSMATGRTARCRDRGGQGRPAQLGRPADPAALDRAHAVRRRAGPSPRRPSSVRAVGARHVRDDGRADACGAGRRLARRQLLAGRRLEGHLGRRGVVMLLSRVAERLYWAARYLERAEGTARIVREHSNVIVDLPLTVPPEWDHLLGITGGREDVRRPPRRRRRERRSCRSSSPIS